VALGFTDHDYLLALGVVPVAVSTRGNGSEERFGVGPWALSKLGETAPKVLPYAEIDTEAVAALRPDLITGFTSGMTAQEYRALSKVAPTVAQPKGEPDYYAPWDVVTRLAGRALGQVGPAGELVADVETRFARARRAQPAFDGATAVYAGVLGPREYYVEAPSSSRVEILTALGFEIPAAIAKLAGKETYAKISRERLDLVDGDVLVWELGSGVRRADIEADPLYKLLPVARTTGPSSSRTLT
jgi:iron complex transport system substrate-binding protein